MREAAFTCYMHDESAAFRFQLAGDLTEHMRAAANLHWLATLLTGSRDIGINVATQVIASAGDDNAFFSARRFCCRSLKEFRSRMRRSCSMWSPAWSARARPIELTGALARMRHSGPNAAGSNSWESEFEYV